MRRRGFIAAAGSVALLPAGAGAQQKPVIGVLSSANIANWGIAALRKGLADQGFEEGRNLSFLNRAADGEASRLPALVAELVAAKVSLIFATGGPLPARAAKAATTTIPIVFAYGGDPVADGLVASLNRPGGNVTGATFIGASLSAKRVEYLRLIKPGASEVAILVNPTNALAETQIKDMQGAVDTLGMHLQVMKASDAAGIDAAFKAMVQQKADVLVVSVDPIFGFLLAPQILELAMRTRIPAIGDARVTLEQGGLISYGADLPDTWRQAGAYAGRILKGAQPQDLPVIQPTKFELVLNRKTAKAMGLELPQKLLLEADDVIE